MAAILGKLWEGYKFMFYELPDQRTISWFLVSKPYQGLALLGLYLMFVLKWGPKLMKGRPAYNLDKLLIVYNLLQVIACIYIFYQAMALAWANDYKWVCEPVDRSNNGRPLEIAKITYWYFLMKVIDLLDTVFFVLRKKFNQVSFLHIYHHTGMVILIWGAATYLPGGHGSLIGVINTFVHIVMYSYYLYTVARPSAKQSVWWKKYITQLQIVYEGKLWALGQFRRTKNPLLRYGIWNIGKVQFFWCVVHMLVIVFKPDCAYPRWTSAVFLPQNCFILVLFVDFYIRTYIKKPKAKHSERTKSAKSFFNNNGAKDFENGVKSNGSGPLNVAHAHTMVAQNVDNPENREQSGTNGLSHKLHS